ncbi:hypothetical protein AAG570_011037 [Ranatra chinensis]|uniref:Reverse transcriptase RNase H-like domain-containing protein n=1 Tax=Ranatra chinensis TaxID=642074 RepID=A0ABD0YJG8_9HEMI
MYKRTGEPESLLVSICGVYRPGRVIEYSIRGCIGPRRGRGRKTCRYSTIERELLGIVWAVQQFRPYLLGRRFVIKTDHKPLVWVEKLDETSSRISRWKEILAAYDFEIKYTSVKDNVVADCLSRQVNVIEEVNEDYAQEFLKEWLGENSDAESEEPWGFEPFPDLGTDDRDVTIDDTIINDKRRQIIIARTVKLGHGEASDKGTSCPTTAPGVAATPEGLNTNSSPTPITAERFCPGRPGTPPRASVNQLPPTIRI